MASLIDAMRDKQWPEFPPGGAAAPSPPRTDEEKNETRNRAHNLISTRCKGQLCCSRKYLNTFGCWDMNQMYFCVLYRFSLSCPEEDGHGVCFSSFPGPGGKQNTGLCECLKISFVLLHLTFLFFCVVFYVIQTLIWLSCIYFF